MLTAQEIRARFLDYFRRHAHSVEASGPLVPPDDSSLLFTNAGMVQFKKFFLGEEAKPFDRAVTCQKCLRVSGKHNDLENVGRTARHHTFFEMLGNFSFGNYFKKDAITWAWDFITNELKLPPEKLWVTVYKDDDEAFKLWKEIAGLPDEKIVRMGEKENFWTMGDTGPCGPCSEIYIDQGEDMACGPDCGIGKCDCDRFLEIWNLVFTQYDQKADGTRTPLAAPNIDTGMGLERIAAICQGKKSNFDCDLFQEIIQYAADVAGVTYSHSAPDTNDVDTALRVIADHGRAAAFLVAEGILPSKENRGYVLRRLVRRALRFATLMGVHEPFLHKVARKVTEVMGDAYPELLRNADFIDKAIYEEEKRFAKTLDKGLGLLDEELARLDARNIREVPGEFCFLLHDTYGFPLDIVLDVAAKKGFSVDEAAFNRLMATQRERARSSQKKTGLLGSAGADALKKVAHELEQEGMASEFVGYATLRSESSVLALLDSGANAVSELGEGSEGYVVVAQTPFYGESGGQAGDSGSLKTDTAQAAVISAYKPAPRIIMHKIVVEAGEMHAGQTAELQVNPDTRLATARNHTCTHLLQAALRKTLGDHVHQAGSHVDSERLRFDFSHFSALDNAQLAEVERQVNSAILADLPVDACEMPYPDALERGAMALFNEKYGDVVRVLTIGDKTSPESVELCGGTHLQRTGQAGSFIIVNESSVASGVRRIEALTGWNAYNQAIGQRAELQAIAQALKSGPDKITEKIQNIQDELKKIRKALDKGNSIAPQNLEANAQTVGNIQLVMQSLQQASIKALRELMDKLRGQYQNAAVVCLAGIEGEKLHLLLYVSKDLHEKFKAPELINIVAKPCGGSGGGRPDLAQAGGSQPEQIGAAFEQLKQFIAEKVA